MFERVPDLDQFVISILESLVDFALPTRYTSEWHEILRGKMEQVILVLDDFYPKQASCEQDGDDLIAVLNVVLINVEMPELFCICFLGGLTFM